MRRIWEILKRLINWVIFLRKQECPYKVHDEGEKPNSRRNYLERLSDLSEYNLQ